MSGERYRGVELTAARREATRRKIGGVKRAARDIACNVVVVK